MFSSQNWLYTYFCGVYDLNDFPTGNETLLAIDDPQADSSNQSCFGNRTGSATFSPANASGPSLTVLGGSLASNRTYHFQVKLTNVLNFTRVFTGDLLVQIEEQSSMMIAVT